MDRNEQNLRIEELKTAMHGRDFEKAVDIADSLDFKKIKDNNLLSLIADAYEISHKYEEAKKVLLIAYENTNAGRQLAYRLCLVTIKTKEFDEAKEFYEDFVEMAPRDTSRYILKYKMAKAQNAPMEKLIKILEEYVNLDMEERWAYELAKLYHLAGDKEKCIDMCDEISLWFSDGKYVAKAVELKNIYEPDTVAAKAADKLKSQEIEEEPDFSDVKIRTAEDEKFNTMDIQAVIADGMKEVEFDDNTNIHEGQQATKIAPDFVNSAKETVEKKENVHPEDVQEITDIEDAMDEIEEADVTAIKDGARMAQDITKPTEEIAEQAEEIVKPDVTEEPLEKAPEENTDKSVSNETTPEIEPIKDIKGVEDILRQLQERGILKAETVQQAVNIIDEAGKSNVDAAPESTMERWEEDRVEPVKEAQKPMETKVEEDVSEVMERRSPEPEVQKSVEEEILEPEIQKSTQEDAAEADIKESLHTQAPKAAAHTAEIKLDTKAEAKPFANGVPVFDLDFDAPKRDTGNDIGQKGIYENTVANSDLGNVTDSIPSKEEIEEAIKKAEQTMETEEAEPLKSGEGGTEFHSDEELSVKVEVLSGTDWKQKEKTSKTEQDTEAVPAQEDTKGVEKQEEPEEKTKDENVGVSAKSSVVNTDLEAEKKAASPPALTEEELSTFKNYLNVEGFATNIKEVLQELIANYTPNGKSTDGNVIIMGDEKTGKTTLAIEMIKLVNKKRGRRNRKLAKVDAEALNRRGFRTSLNKLLGSDLIIENAHNLGAMTLSEVIDASGMFTDDMLIVLEGETEQMERMLSESPRLSETFNHVVRIREYDIKEWVEYGKRYAEEKGYKMDELANLAFYKAIDDFFGTNKGIGQNDVETIVEEAINRSGRIGRKLSGMFSSKKSEDGLHTLVESDFNVK